MAVIRNKEAIEIANLLEVKWLTRYPWPSKIICDKGTEFSGEFAKAVREQYGIKVRVTTTRNPQANSVLERVHLTIGNMLRTMELYDSELPELENIGKWDGVLAAVMLAVRSTVHTTLKVTPAQAVFGRDMLLNIPVKVDWKEIKNNKQKEINRNNSKENKNRIPHDYHVGEKVLIRKRTQSKYGECPCWERPYRITRINDNGTVRIQKGIIHEIVNMRLVKPFQE